MTTQSPARIPSTLAVDLITYDLNKRLPYDPEAAKKLLAEAGYPGGFELKMNCPNDRYVNDGEICQAVAGIASSLGLGMVLIGATIVANGAYNSVEGYGANATQRIGVAN